MTGLQEAFYIIAIIFMGIMFILIMALVAAVFVIRNKIIHIQQMVEDKIHSVSNIAEKGGEIAAKLTRGAIRKTRRAVNNRL